MDKIRTSCPNLPKGWVKEVVIRKSGASAGKSDVYYYSPEGKKCRSKPQMLQYLPDGFDMENFEFRAGKNSDSLKRKRRRDDFNYGRDFTLSSSLNKPSRQTKKARDSIQVEVKNGKDVEGDKSENQHVHPKKTVSRNVQAENDLKKKRAENLSQNLTKPRQLFWQRRLQNIHPVNEKTQRECEESKLDNAIKTLLPGSDNQSLLGSIAYCLFSNSKIIGQSISLNTLRKHPTALCNADQPFTAAIHVSDDMLQQQERRVESARRKLAEAQDLLKALQDEEDEDFDDMEE